MCGVMYLKQHHGKIILCTIIVVQLIVLNLSYSNLDNASAITLSLPLMCRMSKL